MQPNHWGNILVQGFPRDTEVEVTFPINASTTRPSMTVVASRIAGLMAALGPIDTENGDPLADEDLSELGRLLDHLHRVRMHLEGQEERVMELMDARGASLRTIATHLECSPTTVSNRLDRIAKAHEKGLTAVGLDEDEER